MAVERFLVIGFTDSREWDSPKAEASAVAAYLDDAVDFFHIRKKDASERYTRLLLEAIPERLHSRLVLHSHYSLASDFNLRGVHGIVSRGCHSLAELGCTPSNGCHYSFLSPVFDSISKPGYSSNFSLDDSELRLAVAQRPTVALGGVTPSHFQNLFESKFAGAALLGYLWSPKTALEGKIESILRSRPYNSFNNYGIS